MKQVTLTAALLLSTVAAFAQQTPAGSNDTYQITGTRAVNVLLLAETVDAVTPGSSKCDAGRCEEKAEMNVSCKIPNGIENDGTSKCFVEASENQHINPYKVEGPQALELAHIIGLSPEKHGPASEYYGSGGQFISRGILFIECQHPEVFVDSEVSCDVVSKQLAKNKLK